MKTEKRHVVDEILKFLKAPTYFVYICGIVVAFMAVYLPGVAEAGNLILDMGDTVGFSAARYFAGIIGMMILFLPAFAVSASPVRDKECLKRGLPVLRDELEPMTGALLRFSVQFLMMFIPILLLAVYETIAFAGYSGSLQFIALSFTWLLPALLFETALAAAATELTGSWIPGIIVSLVVWVFSQGTTEDVGDYNSCIAIRHQMLCCYDEYSAGLRTLVINRIVVVLIALVLLAAAAFGCKLRRNRKAKQTEGK